MRSRIRTEAWPGPISGAPSLSHGRQPPARSRGQSRAPRVRRRARPRRRARRSARDVRRSRGRHRCGRARGKCTGRILPRIRRGSTAVLDARAPYRGRRAGRDGVPPARGGTGCWGCGRAGRTARGTDRGRAGPPRNKLDPYTALFPSCGYWEREPIRALAAAQIGPDAVGCAHPQTRPLGTSVATSVPPAESRSRGGWTPRAGPRGGQSRAPSRPRV